MPSASFAPLRHRSFTLALTSSLISSTGSWMQTVALGIYLTETTHDAIWLGLLAVAEGLCGSSSWAAWNSLLPDLVERDEVLAAVSLSSAQFNLGRIIGPLFASVALAFGSAGVCFAINAASFVVVVVMFAFVHSPVRPAPTSRVRPWAEIVVGARQAWRVRGCRYPIVAVAIVALTVSPFIALVPAMAIQVLHAGRVGASWMVTAQGVGAVVGALVLPAVARRTSRVGVLRASVATALVADVLYGFAPNLGLAMGALVLLGGAYVGIMTGLNTTVQLHAPRNERSRILSLYTLSLAYPIGALAQAAAARTWGVRPVTVVGAGVLALARTTVWAEFASPRTHVAGLLAE